MLTVEMAAKLTAAGLTTGYTVARGQLLSTPDKQIALYETGGTSPDVAFGGDTVDNPGLQIVVRGEAQDYDGPRETIEAIYQAILSWGAFTQSDTRYLNVTPLQAPFVRNRDGNQRIEFAFNVLVSKELS
jgi:hypothetical protein